jgi:MFS transporter, OPA family, glycerol-3-phosphate transporter
MRTMGHDSRANLRVWQIATVLLLVIGYSGYYLCRSNLSVVASRIVDELQSQGVDPDDARVRIGTIMSLGTFGYAVGKFVTSAAGHTPT